MGAIEVLLGILAFLLIVLLIISLIKKFDKYNTSRLYEIANNYRMGDLGYLYNQWAEFFKDEDFMAENGRVPYGLKFKYYGGTWQLGGASELYWVHGSFQGMQKETPEYKSSWNYWRYDFKSMKHIMENHPNLRDARKKLKAENKKPKIIQA